MDNGGFDAVVSTICLNLNKFPNEVLKLPISEIFEIYSYIKYDSEKQERESDNKIPNLEM